MNLTFAFRAVVIALMLLVTACGGSGGSSTTSPPTTPFPRFGFEVNRGDDTLSVFLINATTGQWRHHGYVTTGSTPVAVAVSFDEKFVFAANDSGSVSGFKLDAASGRLDFVENTTVGNNPSALAMAPNIPLFMYVANAGDDNVAGYTVDTNTGVLSAPATTPLGAGTSPSALVIHPTRPLLYVANSGTGTVSGFSVDTATGALTALFGSPYPVGTNPQDLTIDPSGQFLYVANEGSDNVTAFFIEPATSPTPGALTSPNTVNAGDGPRSVAVAAGGKYAYAANYNTGTISIFSVDATTGDLTAAGTMSDPIAAPRSLRADPSGNFLFVTSETGKFVQRYQINNNTGALSALGTSRTRAQPFALTMSTGTAKLAIRAQYGYAVSSPNTITPYTVSNGALTAGTALNTGLLPTSVATDLYGRFAYVANNSDSSLSGFTINGGNGALTIASGSAYSIANSQPVHVLVEPSGRFAYVSDADPVNGDEIHAFTINSSTGALSANGSIAAGTEPRGTAIDPTGQFLYAANFGTNTISGYRINTANGTLSALSGSPYTVGVSGIPAPASVAIDPSGRYLYVTYSNDDRVDSFAINATTGALAAVGTPVTTGSKPVSVVVEPSGQYVFVANNLGTSISVFTIGSNGALTTNSTASASNTPAWLTVDPSGSYLYLVDGVAIARYGINSNGSLTSPVNTGLAGSTAFTLTGRLQ